MSDAVTADYMKALDMSVTEPAANDGGEAAQTWMSPARDSVLPELRIGVAIAGVFFVGLLGWASLIPLDAAATAEGIVAVAGNRQAVQHRDGGIVTKLNVQEGQFVKEGDLLLQISASDLVAQERGLAGETYALLAQRARLIAERSNARSFEAPVEFAGRQGGSGTRTPPLRRAPLRRGGDQPFRVWTTKSPNSVRVSPVAA